MTPGEFDNWAQNAPAGARVEYHLGFLAKDRVPLDFFSNGTPDCGIVGSMAFSYWRAGVIDLTQRKIRDGIYIYFATKQKNVTPRAEPKRSDKLACTGLSPVYKKRKVAA